MNLSSEFKCSACESIAHYEHRTQATPQPGASHRIHVICARLDLSAFDMHRCEAAPLAATPLLQEPSRANAGDVRPDTRPCQSELGTQLFFARTHDGRLHARTANKMPWPSHPLMLSFAFLNPTPRSTESNHPINYNLKVFRFLACSVSSPTSPLIATSAH